MWQTGTATDHLDLLTQLMQIATAQHVSAAALNAGGTGYVVGDILTIAGGTASHVAQLEVLTAPAGVIATVRISVGGAYTANPTLTANAVTGGTGTGATFDLTMTSTGWTVKRKTKKIATAVIAVAGTGYAVGNVLTIVGGLGIGTINAVVAATVTVATIGGGGDITGVTLTNAGQYEEVPTTNPATVTGGGGTGATITLTFDDFVDTNRILVLEGAAAGMPAGPLVAIKAYNTTNGANDVRNWALFGIAAWQSTLLLHAQAGISPGFVVTGGTTLGFHTTLGVPNVPLRVDVGAVFPIKFWFSITDRKISMVALAENATLVCYSSMYLGFTNQFGTTTELPYPLAVVGSATKWDTHYNVAPTVSPVVTSIVEAVQDSTFTQGPGQMLDPSGVWKTIANATLSSGNLKTDLGAAVIFPFGEPTPPNTGTLNADSIVNDGSQLLRFRDMVDPRFGQTPPYELYASLNTTNPLRMLVPATILVSEGTGASDRRYPFGELDGVYWFSYAGAGVSAGPQDYLDIGAVRYRIFQTGSRTKQSVDFFALKEA